MAHNVTPGQPESVQLAFIRELDRIDATQNDYEAIDLAYRSASERYEALHGDAGSLTWRDQILALRRFGMTHARDLPIGEREKQFKILERVGFPHPSAHLHVLIIRFGYLIAIGEVAAARETLTSLKALAAINPTMSPRDIDETVAEFERRLPRDS